MEFEERVSAAQTAFKAKDWPRAADAYAGVIAEQPNEPELLRQYAESLAHLREYPAALRVIRHAQALEPNHAGGYVIEAGVLGWVGRLGESRQKLERALSLSPYMPAAHWNYALNLLAHGEWVHGWSEYTWGRAFNQRDQRSHPRNHWDGELPLGGTLFLACEQGYGDTLQFVRYVDYARRTSQCARLILEVQPPLVRYLCDYPGIDFVFEQTQDRSIPEPIDGWCSLLDLPGYAATDGEPISGKPYLPRPQAVPKPEASFRVGLCWRGSSTHVNDWQRSLSAAQAATLCQVPGVEYVMLDPREEGAPPLPDFQATAEQIAACDLVISVDTAVAHLSAGMGTPTWVLLPYAGDFRWGLPGEAEYRSPWYDAARCFRQVTLGDWGPVLETVRRELEALATPEAPNAFA